MILKGNRRGGATQLALHLLNAEDNEHVTIHELRGFISDSLTGALTESYALSRGTSCRKYLYSLSLNPPEAENVPVEVFEQAIDVIEKKLGFEGQPRAIVFHEKEGRRHAHCVWSRIDAAEMKAIDPSYDKLQLRDMSRAIYMEQKWKMPRGLMNSEERDPLNFTMAEWQQARRQGQDPRTIKATIQECWAVSDSRQALSSVLRESGYFLSKGDKRGVVVVDWRGEVYSLARMAGIRTKDVHARLGDCSSLPTVGETKAMLSERFMGKLKDYADEIAQRQGKESAFLNERKTALTALHRHVRVSLTQAQQDRRIRETKERAARLPRGIKALWLRLTGKYAAIKKAIEAQADEAKVRDRAELQALIERQHAERRRLQHEVRSMRFRHVLQIRKLNRDMARFLEFGRHEPDKELRQIMRRRRRRHHERGPSVN